MQELNTFNQDLMAFLAASPTPFHAVSEMVSRLQAAGYQALNEAEAWDLTPQGRYYVVRNGSAIIAFSNLGGSPVENGFRMVGAHTDSPCLRVKPNPELNRNGYFQLGVEVYGGALLNPWFDRDLSLAGRVSFKTKAGDIKSALINYAKPIAVIPSLAIHLDREANNTRSINPQKDIPPIVMQAENDQQDFRAMLLAQLKKQQPNSDAAKILDYELSFYDTQPPAIIGLEQDFLASARLDNLLSCYIGLQALLSNHDQNALLVCNDHEEVGSASSCGADGPMLKSVLERIVPDAEQLTRALDRSMMVSADNAHGIHPNYADRHDANHGPQLNRGPVIKINHNQRYATNSETSALIRHLAEQIEVPIQSFVVRTDMACGSTIGPITASGLGVKTLDIGVPTFAMHSIRELAGINDGHYLYQLLAAFYQQHSVAIAN
ncbi:M18 family aminopeptidase [Dasania sp. GY-MA-18]|uniref:M18 family aminopeptidase n=1 Tax=Dasania phycosphaerae TaxID=2950436 RepID=A0A9J6RMQ3_9GAMM|nr:MULTISPECIES: M18 family aminopeptidase [Dasania]MCR8923324.1 M18 family aminopeptidase [Dasania sp. GY-MA-18]MCZ0865756.1 M18 family aminopeptidase [Dasania phycosphaerae]MCZ0869481.1 M18 family aminopeptidase [Dasania phycosphaerae]